jgi:hypothetical protein
MAAPTAPIPVQTAYAVPRGRDFIAIPSSQKLNQAATNVMPVNKCLVYPSDAFMLLDHMISNTPATTSSIHATVVGDIEFIAVIPFM